MLPLHVFLHACQRHYSQTIVTNVTASGHLLQMTSKHMSRKGLDMFILPGADTAYNGFVAFVLRDVGMAEVSPGEVDVVTVVAAEGFSTALAVDCRVHLGVVGRQQVLTQKLSADRALMRLAGSVQMTHPHMLPQAAKRRVAVFTQSTNRHHIQVPQNGLLVHLFRVSLQGFEGVQRRQTARTEEVLGTT